VISACAYSGVDRDVVADVIISVTGCDVMWKGRGDDECVLGGGGERSDDGQRSVDNEHRQRSGQRRSAGRYVVAAAGGHSRVGRRRQRRAVSDDSADTADATERDARVAGVRVRLADAGADVRSFTDHQRHHYSARRATDRLDPCRCRHHHRRRRDVRRVFDVAVNLGDHRQQLDDGDYLDDDDDQAERR